MSQLPDKTAKLAAAPSARDPLYLLLCGLNWREKHDLCAYQELVAALDDANEEIRALAEDLLHRASPRGRKNQPTNAGWTDF